MPGRLPNQAREELQQHFSGYALELRPTEASADVRPRKRAVTRLLSLVMQNKRTLVGILFASLLLNLFGLLSPLFTQQIVDRVFPNAVQPSGDQSLLNWILLGLGSVTVFRYVKQAVSLTYRESMKRARRDPMEIAASL